MKIRFMAAAAITAVLAAPAAHADTTEFLQDVEAAGFTDTASGATGLEEAGTYICAQLDQGQDPATLVEGELLTMTNLNPYQVGEFMGIAVRDLCPLHFPEVEAWANSVSQSQAIVTATTAH